MFRNSLLFVFAAPDALFRLDCYIKTAAAVTVGLAAASGSSSDTTAAVLSAEGPGIDANLIPIPQDFHCPILGEVFEDPVTAVDGHTYERVAISRWFQQPRSARANTIGQGVVIPTINSPMTGLPLPDLRLTPNIALRKAIEAFLQLRPDLQLRSSSKTSSSKMCEVDIQRMIEMFQMDMQQGKQAIRLENSGQIRSLTMEVERLKNAEKRDVEEILELKKKLEVMESRYKWDKDVLMKRIQVLEQAKNLPERPLRLSPSYSQDIQSSSSCWTWISKCAPRGMQSPETRNSADLMDAQLEIRRLNRMLEKQEFNHTWDKSALYKRLEELQKTNRELNARI